MILTELNILIYKWKKVYITSIMKFGVNIKKRRLDILNHPIYICIPRDNSRSHGCYFDVCNCLWIMFMCYLPYVLPILCLCSCIGTSIFQFYLCLCIGTFFFQKKCRCVEKLIYICEPDVLFTLNNKQSSSMLTIRKRKYLF